MREKGVPEKYVRLVKDISKNVKTLVKCITGETEKFTVKVGLDQGSALSPDLFILVIDIITEGIRGTAPGT
jgi:hypothetical protein